MSITSNVQQKRSPQQDLATHIKRAQAPTSPGGHTITSTESAALQAEFARLDAVDQQATL